MHSDIGVLIQTLGGLSAFGLIAWLVKRTFSHTIPRLAQDFKEALQSQTDFFREELRAQRADYREELRAQREELRHLGTRIDRLSDEIERLVRWREGEEEDEQG